MGKNKGNKEAAAAAAATTSAAKTAPQEIAAVPGFFGHVVKPGQALVWDNDVEEFALQLTTAALGPKVTPGRSTLIAEAKDAKTALCTLIPEKTEQWNLTHLFTPFDGPVTFRNEGVNEIHLTGLVDVQDDEDDDGCGDHDHDHDHEDDSEDDEEMVMDGTYSDSDDDEVMVFGGDDDGDDSEDDSEDDDAEAEDDEGRFEVIEERLHGEVGEKKKKNEAAKKEVKKKEATPAKKEKEAKKETTPAKKEEKKKEATPAKKEEKKEAKKDETTKKSVAEKVAEATGAINNKKRAAPADAVDVPKKAKPSTRVYKGVTIEEVAVGKGQPVARGKKVSIIYRGRLENGKQFDATQNRKKPFVFRHGVGDVIKGMDIGIEGMRVGGKRTITIPSHLGYGKSGAPPTIPGNSTLIFEIEVL